MAEEGGPNELIWAQVSVSMHSATCPPRYGPEFAQVFAYVSHTKSTMTPTGFWYIEYQLGDGKERIAPTFEVAKAWVTKAWEAYVAETFARELCRSG